MNIEDISVGDRVEFRPNFGTGSPMLAYVEDVDTHKGNDVVDLSNGSWAYTHQIIRIYSKA